MILKLKAYIYVHSTTGKLDAFALLAKSASIATASGTEVVTGTASSKSAQHAIDIH